MAAYREFEHRWKIVFLAIVTSHTQLLSCYFHIRASSRLNGTFSYTFNLTFHGCQRDERINSSSPLSPTSSIFSGPGSGSSGNSSETGDPVRFLEHVQVYADIYYYRRGLCQLTVISPSGERFPPFPPSP